MSAEKEPPIPSARVRTLAAAVSVALYRGSMALALLTLPHVLSRSFARAWVRLVICCPRLASCDTRLNWAALSAAPATRSAPNTRPTARVSMITANSRHDTGQFRRLKACELRRWKSVDVLARSFPSLARNLALAPPWLPIVHILADYAQSEILSPPAALTRSGGSSKPADPGAIGMRSGNCSPIMSQRIDV